MDGMKYRAGVSRGTCLNLYVWQKAGWVFSVTMPAFVASRWGKPNLALMLDCALLPFTSTMKAPILWQGLYLHTLLTNTLLTFTAFTFVPNGKNFHKALSEEQRGSWCPNPAKDIWYYPNIPETMKDIRCDIKWSHMTKCPFDIDVPLLLLVESIHTWRANTCMLIQ